MSLLPGGADCETNDILPVQILKIYRFERWKRAGFWLDPRSISARSASVLRGFAGGRGALRPFAAQQGADDEVSDAPKLYNNLNGLYLYDGVFQGVFSRLGPLPTISKDMQGMTAATIWVD